MRFLLCMLLLHTAGHAIASRQSKLATSAYRLPSRLGMGNTGVSFLCRSWAHRSKHTLSSSQAARRGYLRTSTLWRNSRQPESPRQRPLSAVLAGSLSPYQQQQESVLTRVQRVRSSLPADPFPQVCVCARVCCYKCRLCLIANLLSSLHAAAPLPSSRRGTKKLAGPAHRSQLTGSHGTRFSLSNTHTYSHTCKHPVSFGRTALVG